MVDSGNQAAYLALEWFVFHLDSRNDFHMIHENFLINEAKLMSIVILRLNVILFLS